MIFFLFAATYYRKLVIKQISSEPREIEKVNPNTTKWNDLRYEEEKVYTKFIFQLETFLFIF